MSSAFLYVTYLLVMAAGLGCFVAAFRTRRVTRVHRRWGLLGTALSLGGIAVVLLGAYAWGWRVEHRWPEAVMWHRRVAYVAAALVALTAVTGALRLAIHPRLYRLMLPAYVLSLVLAILGYGP